MKLTKILNIATFAGTIMLENGGETYRVEEVVGRVCEAYGVEVSCYATITGIMASARNQDDDHESVTIRVTYRTINLDIIHKVNDICRNVNDYDIDSFKEKLEKIKNEPKHSIVKNTMAYALAGGSFTLLFGGTPMDFLGSSIISMLVFAYLNYFSKFEVNGFFRNCIASAILAFFSVIFQRIGIIDNLDTTISGAIMLLVPGMTLTNSVRDLIAGDYMAGIARGVEALLIAMSLAAGSGFVLAILL